MLKHLQKISLVAGHCTRDINLDDEAFESDEGSLSVVVYNVSFPVSSKKVELLICGTVYLRTSSNAEPPHCATKHIEVYWLLLFRTRSTVAETTSNA